MTNRQNTPKSSDPLSAARANILGGTLAVCSRDPMTGFYRDGFCACGPQDVGLHAVCAVMTEAFLAYTAAQGNDLSTPRPEFRFPGLKPGDRWCVCASRWEEARQAGCAPRVVAEATSVRALEVVELDDLLAHAVDTPV